MKRALLATGFCMTLALVVPLVAQEQPVDCKPDDLACLSFKNEALTARLQRGVEQLEKLKEEIRKVRAQLDELQAQQKQEEKGGEE